MKKTRKNLHSKKRRNNSRKNRRHFGGNDACSNCGEHMPDMATCTPYQVLGLTPDASIKDIKKTYRKLALKHHPDKGGNEECFKWFVNAYSIIGDNDKLESVHLSDFVPMLIGPGGTTLNSFKDFNEIRMYGKFIIDASAISFFGDEGDVTDYICEIPASFHFKENASPSCADKCDIQSVNSAPAKSCILPRKVAGFTLNQFIPIG